MIGFGFLCFAFQYDKHFASQVGNDLLGSIQSKGASVSMSKFDLITKQILPAIFYLLGWGFLFAAIIKEAIVKKKDTKVN